MAVWLLILFQHPPINEHVLSVSESDFINHPSVVDIANQSYQLNFSFEPVTLEYVTKLLLDLDEKKSCGPDGFPPKILKLSAPAIATSLTKIFILLHCYLYLASWLEIV